MVLLLLLRVNLLCSSAATHRVLQNKKVQQTTILEACRYQHQPWHTAETHVHAICRQRDGNL